MNEYLTAENHQSNHSHNDPYTPEGAARILSRFRFDVIDMLDEMEINRKKWDNGKTMLARCCLRSKPYVAAAMKTVGWVEEIPTATGACALVLTNKAIAQMAALKRAA